MGEKIAPNCPRTLPVSPEFSLKIQQVYILGAQARILEWDFVARTALTLDSPSVKKPHIHEITKNGKNEKWHPKSVLKSSKAWFESNPAKMVPEWF